MNWEYDGYEQHLVTTKGRIEPGGQYKDNGEWKMMDSSGCVQIQNTDEGPVVQCQSNQIYRLLVFQGIIHNQHPFYSL